MRANRDHYWEMPKQMGRIAFAVRVKPDQLEDVRTVAKDFNAAFDDFVSSRKQFGLTSLTAWLQDNDDGPCVVVYVEGDLEKYFSSTQAESGIDEYLRQKIKQWSGSDRDPPAMFDYPQGNLLFEWSET